MAFQQPGEGCTALLQRQCSQVLTAQPGQVEQVVGDALVMLGVEGVLQGLEVGHAVVVDHYHLAVQPCRVEAQGLERLDLPGHLRTPVVAITGKQAYVVTVDTRQDAVAVELDFVAPIAAWRGIDQRGQLRLEYIRQGFAAGSLVPGGGRLGRAARGQGALAQHAVRQGLDNAVVRFTACLPIMGLDQHPLLFLAGQVSAEQVPDP